jgi:hypothetical protein
LRYRTFTQTAVARNAAGLPTSLQAFTEEEMMLRETGKKNKCYGEKRIFMISNL